MWLPWFNKVTLHSGGGGGKDNLYLRDPAHPSRRKQPKPAVLQRVSALPNSAGAPYKGRTGIRCGWSRSSEFSLLKRDPEATVPPTYSVLTSLLSCSPFWIQLLQLALNFLICRTVLPSRQLILTLCRGTGLAQTGEGAGRSWTLALASCTLLSYSHSNSVLIKA